MIPNQIKLSGIVYIKYVTPINNPHKGDIKLLLNDDAISVIQGDYETLKSSGYIKAKVFDGYRWQNIDITQFCQQKENKFAKKQRSIDSAMLCREILASYAKTIIYKTYRGHFTIYE